MGLLPYHVPREDIFFDKADRLALLEILAEAHVRWGLIFHAYCLMPNHYHLEVQSPEGHLSRPIQWINQKYAGHVNRTHHRVGHLFQGRFKSALIESGGHLRELTRYIHLNPVRAGLVRRPADYAWSSYRAYLGLKKCPEWLRMETTLERFGKSPSEQRGAYRDFVEEGERTTSGRSPPRGRQWRLVPVAHPPFLGEVPPAGRGHPAPMG